MPSNKMERFTHRARRVLNLAQGEAESLGHRSIGTGHLFLGLIREEDGVAGRVLRELKISYEQALPIVVELSPDEAGQPGSQMELSPNTKRVLEGAVTEARRFGHDYIGTEHLLYAITLQADSVAVKALEQLKLDSETVQKRIVRTIRQDERAVLRPGMKPLSSLIRQRFASIMPSPMLPPSNPEAMKILQMIQDGNITPEQGEQLLRALPPIGFASPGWSAAINLDKLVAEDDNRQLRVVIISKETGDTLFYTTLPIQGVPNQLGNVLSAISNGMVGNCLTIGDDMYEIDLFIDKPADEEAS